MYPKTIPVDAVNILFQAALNVNSVDKKKLVAAIYQITGYILGQAIGEPAQLVGMAQPDPEMQVALQTTLTLVQQLIEKNGVVS